ncbi:LEPR-XLL domain-containing protein, partial [bacterium]|nr:LEPR-XLL domain-containing protein [bacterium]
MSLPRWRRLRLNLEALEPRLLLSATSATQEFLDVDALAGQTVPPPEPVSAIAYPTAYDQYMLELTNRARSDPDAEATRLGLDPFGGLNEGVESEDTISPDPKQPLAFNLNIIDASQKHSQWMLDNDTFSHNEPVPNFDAGDRMANAGYSFPNTPGSSWGWGENIGMVMSWPDPYDMTTGTRMNYENLFVDEDYEPLPPGTPRGHRVNICNGDFREIGVGVLPGIYSGAYEWEAVAATQDFAYSSYVGTSRFLTGVAYDDDAVLDDDFYTPGEGLGGVLIRATRQPDCVVF